MKDVIKTGMADVVVVLVQLGGGILSTKGAPALWFTKQLMYLLADVVDQSLFDHGWTNDLAEDAFQPGKFQRKDADREEARVLGLPDRQANKPRTALRGKRCVGDDVGSSIVGKYFLGSRRHFSNQLHVCMAVDAARIGDVEALYGMLLGGD